MANTKTDPVRDEILRRFSERVLNRCPPNKRGRHDGAAGHWLEEQMGIRANGRNEPDLMGYEMKKFGSKISFGDWSADKYIFKPRSNISMDISRDDFLRIFGKANANKGGRFSWSGEVVPKVGNFNSFGQRLAVDHLSNITAEYSFLHDERAERDVVIPDFLRRKDPIPIAQWTRDKIKTKLERKFAQKGFFICMQDKVGMFTELRFGRPFFFDEWIEFVKSGVVFFDSGMYQGNMRPYSQWRASADFWLKILE